MSAKVPMTSGEAAVFLTEHDLGLLDLCELLLVLAERVDGSIKWSHPRVLVHIKRRPRVARGKGKAKEKA